MAGDPKELSIVLSETAQPIEDLFRQAFEAGRTLGRREAAGALRERLMRVVDLETGEAPDAGDYPLDDDVTPQRAAPGSVKPIILNLVLTKPGLTTSEIQQETGVKFNSARGTLWTLSQEKVVVRRLGRWFPRPHPDADGVDAGDAVSQE